MKQLIIVALVVTLAVVGWRYWQNSGSTVSQLVADEIQDIEEAVGEIVLHELTIESLRQGEYPGSDFILEETLGPGSNYKRQIVSYESEGNTIYALLTIPNSPKPRGGYPVIIFNHGFIPPAQYRTTERYVAYVDGFARNGYMVLRSDYRGHGSSEGQPSGAYGSNGYTIDVLNAVASIKNHPDANPKKIGMWGHSMGGHITLRNMVVNQDVKAGVIWAGVVGSYPDLVSNWRRSSITPTTSPTGSRRWRQQLIEEYGTPEANPAFWNSISATAYLGDISGPLQLHHGTADSSVPVAFSQTLEQLMQTAGKSVELFVYNRDDHNLSRNFSTAMRRSIEFFDKYLK